MHTHPAVALLMHGGSCVASHMHSAICPTGQHSVCPTKKLLLQHNRRYLPCSASEECLPPMCPAMLNIGGGDRGWHASVSAIGL